MMQPAPNMMVTPSIRLTAQLGAGGMGCVWSAEHLTLKTQVAVKFLTDAIATDTEMQQRFMREATLAANIKSPHVVQMLDNGTMADGTPYMVMEKLEGQPLSERLRQQGALDLETVQLLLSQMCPAIGRAHEIGIVHRDLKPENLFLVDTGYQDFLKVLDFGISKSTQVAADDVNTSTEMVAGTPKYMSPEQLMSTKDVDARADLWAIAVIAYHMITGKAPFEGETVTALSMAVCLSEFPKPSERVAGLPPFLDDWFRKALDKEPENRFASADELLRTFLAACSGDAARVPSPIVHALPQGQFSQPMAVPPFGHGATSTPQTFQGSSAAIHKQKNSGSSWALGVGAVLLVVGGGLAGAHYNGAFAPSDGATQAAVESAETELEPTPSPAGSTTTTSRASAAVSAAASPTESVQVKAPPVVTTQRPPAAPRVDCSNPYYRTASGDLGVKKGCE